MEPLREKRRLSSQRTHARSSGRIDLGMGWRKHRNQAFDRRYVARPKPVSVYCKTLYVVRLAGHPYILPDKFYGMFSSIKVIDLENIGAYEAPTRDDNHKIAVVLPQDRFVKRNAGYFRQKMEEFTADYRI